MEQHRRSSMEPVCDRIENSDRIGIILAGTGPDYKPEKVNRIGRIFKTLIINLQVTNINLHGSFNFEICVEGEGQDTSRHF